MLLYLPERIYNTVLKDDKTYAEMVNKATASIFTNDFVKSMIDYENDNPLIKELQDYIKEQSPEEYKMELELSFNDDLFQFENSYKTMDLETKMYWLCEVDGGNQVDTKEFSERNEMFNYLYEHSVIYEPEKYSNFLHMMYYAKMVYTKIIELSNSNHDLDTVKAFVDFEEKIYNECSKRANDERFYQMMYSKKEQMYVLFFEVVGQYCNDYEECFDIISDHVYNGDFKYNEFTYFRCLLNLIMFQLLIDSNKFNEAKIIWLKLVGFINYAFEHKDYAIKSLNHYNNSFLDEFLGLAKYVYYINNKMTTKYLSIDKYFVGLEIDFFGNKFDNEFLKKYLNPDPSYSYVWAKSKKVIFEMF